MCNNATKHKSYGTGLTAFNKVHKRTVYILRDIIIFFYRWFYDTAARGSLMESPNAKAVYGNISPVAATYYV